MGSILRAGCDEEVDAPGSGEGLAGYFVSSQITTPTTTATAISAGIARRATAPPATFTRSTAWASGASILRTALGDAAGAASGVAAASAGGALAAPLGGVAPPSVANTVVSRQLTNWASSFALTSA